MGNFWLGYLLELQCKYINAAFVFHDLVYRNLFLAVLTGTIVHGSQPFRILLSMFPFFLFLVRERVKKSIERPQTLHCWILYFLVRCTAMFYSTQGSTQPLEIRQICREPNSTKVERQLHKDCLILSFSFVVFAWKITFIEKPQLKKVINKKQKNYISFIFD